MEAVLEQALAQPNKHHFAHAKGLANYEMPTERALSLLMTLINEQGEEWLEVVERLIMKDYPNCFRVCIEHEIAYPILITTNNPLQEYQ